MSKHRVWPESALMAKDAVRTTCGLFGMKVWGLTQTYWESINGGALEAREMKGTALVRSSSAPTPWQLDFEVIVHATTHTAGLGSWRPLSVRLDLPDAVGGPVILLWSVGAVADNGWPLDRELQQIETIAARAINGVESARDSRQWGLLVSTGLSVRLASPLSKPDRQFEACGLLDGRQAGDMDLEHIIVTVGTLPKWPWFRATAITITWKRSELVLHPAEDGTWHEAR